MISAVLVSRFLSYVKMTFPKNDTFYNDRCSLEELFRYAVCYGLGLDTAPATQRVKVEAIDCAEYVLYGIDTRSWTKEFKVGVLEGGIKCLCLACDRVDGK